MKKELTLWFPGTVKPVRVGVYERAFGWRPAYAAWTGSYWVWAAHYDNNTPAAASKMLGKSCHQDEPWRGLAHDPEAK